MNLVIRPFCLNDVEVVVSIHEQAFPTSRSTCFGKPYLRKMFTWFLKFQSNLCFVAVYDGVLAGYIVGAIGGYGRKIFRYALPEVIWGFFTHPNLWFSAKTFSLWHSYLYALNPLDFFQISVQMPLVISESRYPVQAALAGIGVVSSLRGLGVGKRLLQDFELAAKNAGVGLLSLSVEVNNPTACKLYESCGWHVDSCDSGTNSLHYIKKLEVKSA